MSKAKGGAVNTINKPPVTRQASGATQVNTVAANSKMGPGAGRTIYPTGSQAQHGQPAKPKEG